MTRRACETHGLLDQALRVSDPPGLGWVLRICVSNKFSGDADDAGLATTLREALA